MGVHKPRTRVVFFRVSEEEFHNMEKACDTVGARSISDFARTAAIRLINSADHGGGDPLTAKLSRIDQWIDHLHGRMQAIAGVETIGQALHSPAESPLQASAEEHL